MGIRERDVVIVGGGHNGLACAGYLAREGLDVLVLERRGISAARPRPRSRGPVTRSPPRLRGQPDAAGDRSTSSSSSDSATRSRSSRPTTSSRSRTAPPRRSGAISIATSRTSRSSRKRDADAYVEFDRYFERIADAGEGAVVRRAAEHRAFASCRRWRRPAGGFAGGAAATCSRSVRLFTMSAADFLDEWFEDDRVKGALATQAIVGAWCGPMSPGSAYVLMHHWIGEIDGHFGAWGWVKGGMGGVVGRPRGVRPSGRRRDPRKTPVARIMVTPRGQGRRGRARGRLADRRRRASSRTRIR